jgi:hypothetical protein
MTLERRNKTNPIFWRLYELSRTQKRQIMNPVGYRSCFVTDRVIVKPEVEDLMRRPRQRGEEAPVVSRIGAAEIQNAHGGTQLLSIDHIKASPADTESRNRLPMARSKS